MNTEKEAAAVGLRRGCGLNCGSVYQSALKEAVEDGLVDEGEIDIVLYRLMLAHMKLGMFAPPEMVSFAQIPFAVNDSKPHDEMALKMAEKSMNLLKNSGILPLNKKKIKKIAIVGPNVNSLIALYANYNCEATKPVTIIEGIKKAVGQRTRVTFSEGVPLVIDESRNKDYSAIEGKYLFTHDAKGKRVQGLLGEYFNNMDLNGDAQIKRIDPQMNFNWMGSLTTTEVAQGILQRNQAISSDNFSVRWTGKLTAPKTGTYKLGMVSDDGCRVWVDGKKIADGWSNHAMAPYLGTIDLQKGKTYDIKLEYYESSGGADSILVWKIPGKERLEKKQDRSKLSKETLNDVKKADVAIFVGGLDANWEGEETRGRTEVDGFDRGDRTKIELPQTQLEALKAMKETGTPVVLVLMAGTAIAFDGLEKELDAVLMTWYPGQCGGDAVSDVLFGDYNPEGRLPVTFYSSTEELPDFRDYNMRVGKGFTYRYHTGHMLYLFGHGLSYTRFEYSNLKTNKTIFGAGDTITVSVKVKNRGAMDGEEVVQLYVSDLESNKWMP